MHTLNQQFYVYQRKQQPDVLESVWFDCRRKCGKVAGFVFNSFNPCFAVVLGIMQSGPDFSTACMTQHSTSFRFEQTCGYSDKEHTQYFVGRK